MNYKLLLFILAFGILFTISAQKQVQLTPAKDNTLYEDDNGSLSNGEGDYIFVGNTNNGAIRRAVLQFDLSNIEENAQIDSVTLNLNMSKSRAGSETVSLHLLESDWGEGASDASGEEGGGAAAATGDATWIHTFFDTETWSTPGGDFVSTASASQAIAGTGEYTFESTNQLVADVQSWVDDPANNFGWILIGNEAENQTAKRFDSKDNPTADNQPVLTVFYSTPTGIEDDVAEIIPENINLAQNFPNPFNPSTRISYTISQVVSPAKVRVEIFNQLGQRINTLVEKTQQAGSYTVEWNGRTEKGNQAPSGVYVYRLIVGNRVLDGKKMTLLR